MTTRASATGHYAGAFSRLAAFVIDWFLIVTAYGAIVAGSQWFAGTFLGLGVEAGDGRPLVWLVGFAAWAWLYLSVGVMVTGRTIGKSVLGLRVVTREGRPVSAVRAGVRALSTPLSFLVLGLGLAGIVLGRERRALHDVIAGTAVVYDWGDRPAEVPAPLTRWLERRGVDVMGGSQEAGGAASPRPPA